MPSKHYCRFGLALDQKSKGRAFFWFLDWPFTFGVRPYTGNSRVPVSPIARTLPSEQDCRRSGVPVTSLRSTLFVCSSSR
jgi:hypothetical protein